MKALSIVAHATRFPISVPRLLVGVGLLASIAAGTVFGESFVPTAGVQTWNDPNNWSPASVPNSDTATASIPEPTDDLTINLGQPTTTVNALNLDKPLSGSFTTTITGGVGEQLIFAGTAPLPTLQNAASIPTAGGTGKTIISAPVSLGATLTVTQRDNDELRFDAPISGPGGLTIFRSGTGAGTGDGVVVLGAANSFQGATTLNPTPGGTTGQNYITVRLNDVNSIPGGIDFTGGTANLSIQNATLILLASSDFRRAIGTGPDQVSFSNITNSGFAAIGAPRAVNFGNGATITWNATFIGQANTFVLGAASADNTVDFQNNIVFNNTATRTVRVIDGSASVDGKISGAISGTGAFTKVGGGTLSLSGVNTYTGATTVTAGILQLDNAQALPGGLLTLNGGIISLGAADFARPVGTTAGSIQFTPTAGEVAGFAAVGGYRKVLLNGDPNSVLTWDVNFVKNTSNFVLSDDSADNTVEFQNRIDLNGGIRTFATRDGTSGLDARITNTISGGPSSGLLKTQQGSLELAVANTYEGVTNIGGGLLVVTNANAIPGGTTGGNTSNITFSGGNARIGLGAADFTSPLGTGPGQVQFLNTGDGGFAAYGADRVVNFGGASAPLVWDTGNFAPKALILGSSAADKTIDFQHPIDLNGALRVIASREGGAFIEGIFSGVISGTGGLQKNGAGALALTAPNTYDGGTAITVGRVYVNNTTGSGVGVGDVTVSSGATVGGSGFVGTAGDNSNVNVLTGGHIAPGSGVGQLSVAGTVSLATGTFFDAELGGVAPGTFDRLSVDGAVALSGTLGVTLANGYLPTAGNSYELVAATGGVTGTFEGLSLPSLPGIAWQVLYNPNSVVLTTLSAGVAGDYSNDGVVDAADYVLWRKGGPLANEVATPGLITSEDYDAWRARFGNTSGSGRSAGSAVPEPSASIMLVLAMLAGITRRSK